MSESKKPQKFQLTPLQIEVTQNCQTEPPFQNEYWDNHREGIYVDIINGTPLFISIDKFDSGTGWPSFTKPLQENAISRVEDNSHNMSRTEVRSATSDSHLGHVFSDGPGPKQERFCINSASLRFIPLENIKEEGYSEYLKYFTKK